MKLAEILKNPESIKELEMNEILTTLKDGITKENIKDISQIIKMPEIQRYVNYLVGKHLANEKVSEADFQNLYLLIHILQSIYNYSGEETGVSDYDYDRLYELMEQYGVELVTVPLLTKDKTVRHHKYPSLPGTLKKIYALTDDERRENKSRDSLKDWVESRERDYLVKTGNEIDLWEEEIYVFPKWDGVSVTFEFDKNNNLKHALLRGNTETNEADDVTFIFSTIVNRIRDPFMNNKKKEYGLKTEVMMYEKDLNAFNKKYHEDYKSTRSIISSIVNSDTIDGREQLLEIIGLRRTTLDEYGVEQHQELATDVFNRPYIRCRLKDVAMIKAFADSHTDIDGLRCDGAVIHIIDPKIQKVLGRKDHKNQYEVAYKFNEEIAYPKITGIRFSVTNFGRIFPTAQFTPSKMKGNTVTEASLGSMARFHELSLHVGDQVKVLYEIIPYLTMDKNDPNCKRGDGPLIEAPTNCPECGEPLERNERLTILNCVNPKCDCRKRGKIINYVTKMEIGEIGEKKVSILFNEGLLKKVEDLYTLKDKYSQMIQIPGFDSISVTKIIRQIQNKSVVDADVLMGSVGIECVGKKTFQKIFTKYKIEDLLEFAEDCSVSKLIEFDGIGDIVAKKILDGISENAKLIRFLIDELTIVYPKTKDSKFKATFHKIRSEMVKDLVESYGGEIGDFTKSTAFLIIPNGFNDETSKIQKAKKYGIPTVEIDDVEKYLENHFS